MKKVILFCLILPVIAFASCGSKTPDDNPTKNLSEVLVQGEWTSVIDLEDIDQDGVFVEFGEACEKDDHWIFNTTGKFQQNTGATDCDGGPGVNSLIVEADWELKNNNQDLVLSFFADEMMFKIISFTDHELQLALIEANNPVGVITQKIILKR